jgi:hypothetical protein
MSNCYRQPGKAGGLPILFIGVEGLDFLGFLDG